MKHILACFALLCARKDRSELAAARAQAEALKKKCGAACEDAKSAPEPGQK